MEPTSIRPCALRRCGAKEYQCTVELALQVIGGKWKPLILWRLGAEGVLRFGQLRRSMPAITQKMLTQQLRELEADGLLLRTVHAEVPPRVEYRLTAMGQTIMPLLEALCQWGHQYEQENGGGPVEVPAEMQPEALVAVQAAAHDS